MASAPHKLSPPERGGTRAVKRANQGENRRSAAVSEGGAFRDRTGDLRLAKRLCVVAGCRVVPSNSWKGLLLRVSNDWRRTQEGTRFQPRACDALAPGQSL